MLNYRPKMFDESSDTNTSKELFLIICSFVVVFMITRGLNAIAPSIALSRLIKQEEEISSNDPRVKIPYLFGTVLGIIVAIIYCRFLEHRPVRSMGVRKKGFLVHYLSGILVGAALMTSTILMTELTGTGTVKLCENVNYIAIPDLQEGESIRGMVRVRYHHPGETAMILPAGIGKKEKKTNHMQRKALDRTREAAVSYSRKRFHY